MDEDRRTCRLRSAAVVLVLLASVFGGSASAGAQEAVCPPDDAERPDGFDDPNGSTVTEAEEYFREEGLGVRVVGPRGGVPDDALVADWGIVSNVDDVVAFDAVLCAGTEVPDLADLTVADARTALEEAQLVGLDDDADADFVVVGQRPEPGALVRYGAAVELDTEPPEPLGNLAVVPPLLGRTVDDAERVLDEAGLELGGLSGDADGLVVDQNPRAGERVELGTAVAVTLEASLVTVPDVRGLEEGDARDAVTGAGLVLDVDAGDSGDVGIVADQDPAPGVRVRPGTQVIVFVPIAAPLPPPDDGSSSPVAAVLLAVIAVLLIWLLALLVRACLRGRARRRDPGPAARADRRGGGGVDPLELGGRPTHPCDLRPGPLGHRDAADRGAGAMTTTTEPRTIGSLLYGERAEGEERVRRELERRGLAAAVVQGIAGLGTVGREAVLDQVAQAVASLLGLDVGDELVVGVGKYREVVDAARRTAGPPPSAELVSLASRRLTSVHRPVVDVEIDGRLVHRLQLDLRLVAVLRGVGVTVAAGRITQVLGGYADVEITFDLDGVRLGEWKGTTPVPVMARVSIAVPLTGLT